MADSEQNTEKVNDMPFKSKKNEMTINQMIQRDYEDTGYGRTMSQ